MDKLNCQTVEILLSITLVFPVVCNADVITIDLAPALLTGAPGSTVTFSGRLENMTPSTVFLNAAGINLSGGFMPSDEDLNPFFANAPLFLDVGEVTSTIEL